MECIQEGIMTKKGRIILRCKYNPLGGPSAL